MANIMFLLIISFFASYHPLHVSVTEIEHDEEEKRLEVVMRLFIDDLELSIKNQTGRSYLDITAPGEGTTTDELLENYLKNKLKIKINGKEREVEYVGYEVELPIMLVYVKVENVRKLKEISVYNDLIMETYDDQANLVHVEANDDIKSLKLTTDQKEAILTF